MVMFVLRNASLTYSFFLCEQLVEQESEGECNTECKTIEKACQEVN